MSVYLDTHVAVWLHDGLVERLSTEAKRQMEDHDVLLSPVVLLELQYLYDRKRVGLEPLPIYNYLNATFGIELCTWPFSAIVSEALKAGWTNDPFDRLIVSHAKASGDSVLLTADVHIRRHYPQATW